MKSVRVFYLFSFGRYHFFIFHSTIDKVLLSILGDGSWKAEQFSAVVENITTQAQKLGIEIG